MKYAVIKTGGKQYKVKEGDEILVEKIEGKEKTSISFPEILLVVNDEKRSIGKPVVKNFIVKGKLLSQVKGKKIRIATYKAKSRYRKVKGHRQRLSKVLIEKISQKTKSKVKTKSKKTSNN